MEGQWKVEERSRKVEERQCRAQTGLAGSVNSLRSSTASDSAAWAVSSRDRQTLCLHLSHRCCKPGGVGALLLRTVTPPGPKTVHQGALSWSGGEVIRRVAVVSACH